MKEHSPLDLPDWLAVACLLLVPPILLACLAVDALRAIADAVNSGVRPAPARPRPPLPDGRAR